MGTEENFSLRRKLDEQEIDFDKKLMNVRKAVALQADAFANLQNHFNCNNNNNNSNALSLANDVETARNKVITLTTEKHALELEILKYKKKNNILSNENISLKQQYE